MAQEYLPEMRKSYPPLQNSYAQSYLGDLGGKIVASNNLNGKPYQYHFTLVQSPQVNAFALPAGEVFVTTQLMKMADSEAELAGVVGHEIGHVQSRHTAERITKAKKEQGKSLLYGLGGALIGGAAGFALGKKLCRKEDRACLQRVSLYGAAAGGAGGLLIQKFAFMANSREDEMEADRIGFKTAYQAGYDKNTIGLFYEKLLAMEQSYRNNQNALSRSFADALSTHPPGRERVQQMRELAAQAPAGRGIKNTQDFLKARKMIS